MTTRVLIPTAHFEDYFTLLYRLKFNDIEIWNDTECIKSSRECTDDELGILLQAQDKLKEQIKTLFEDSIINKNVYPTDKLQHQFLCNNPNDDCCLYIKTDWIETDNKIKLYKYFLFDCEIIKHWFVYNRDGIYFDNINEGSHNSCCDSKYGIEYLDLIGLELCSLYNFIGSRHNFTVEEVSMIYNYKKTDEFIDIIIKKFQKEIKPYVKKSRDCSDYKSLEKIYSPKKYLNEDNMVCWDLLEIFDVFLNSQIFFGICSRDPVIIKKL